MPDYLIPVLADIIDWVSRIVTIVSIIGSLSYFSISKYRKKIVASFIGSNHCKIYFPLRHLDGRRAIAEADFHAAEKLSSFLQSYGLTVEFRFIDPSSNCNNFPNGSIVICGPKSAPSIKNILDLNTEVNFTFDDSHYCLLDNISGIRYFSRKDLHGRDSDIGYLARNITIKSSRFTVISIAGIHAEGSAIVADYLSRYSNIKRLYKDSKNKLFTAIIGGDYSIDPFIVRSSDLVFKRIRDFPQVQASELAVIQHLDCQP